MIDLVDKRTAENFSHMVSECVNPALDSNIPKNLFCFFQVFSEMDFLGWYSTGDAPTEADVHVHKQVRPDFTGSMKNVINASSLLVFK